jgi:hypothetical protein
LTLILIIFFPQPPPYYHPRLLNPLKTHFLKKVLQLVCHNLNLLILQNFVHILPQFKITIRSRKKPYIHPR